jgi:hypothetical protein
MMDESKEERFNYNAFRREYENCAIVKSLWIEQPSKEELEAKTVFSKINIEELEKYFLYIINECQSSISLIANEKFNSRIKYIRKKYCNPEILKYELLKYKTSIAEFRNIDSSIYKKARTSIIKDGTAITNENIARYSVQLIEKQMIFIDRLISITDYKSSTYNSMLNDKIYNRHIEPVFESFQDLFKEDQAFEKIIKLLVDNSQITKTDMGYEWNEVIDGTVVQPKTSLCVFGILLRNKNYFKGQPGNKLIAHLLSSFFCLEVSDSYYCKVKNNQEKYQEYFIRINYIPKV